MFELFLLTSDWPLTDLWLTSDDLTDLWLTSDLWRPDWPLTDLWLDFCLVLSFIGGSTSSLLVSFGDIGLDIQNQERETPPLTPFNF